ncbi:MAG TPA: monovalent cation:proton antiporter-2 (CPA2) family protein [Burkholderiales bacterium]|nr:monovalent cation:proton antiporter-2 (CPA2) family protein [Burkholderiales bacterium]
MDTDGFLRQALVYLGAAIVAVPLFTRLGAGSVLGYLVAGIAIGPWGLRLITEPRTVLQFAELGIVLLLFLVGLELNARRVWQLRRAIFGLGAAQVLATTAAIALAAYALGQPLVVGVVAGMALAMSSDAIGLALLQEKNLLATPGGQASFAVLLFQDLAVIPLLLALAFLGGEAQPFAWTGAAKALAFVLALIAAGRLLVRPLLRYIAETRLRELFVAFSLFLVLGTALLADAVGLSMGLGAFLAGVMLAESEYRHELELDIEPFKGLLLGLFFMAVGMSVDLGLFARVPHVVVGLALAIVALKSALLFPTARLFGYCRATDAGLFAVALSQAGEFAFVVFNAAANVLPAQTVGVLNAAVALSMLTTPPLMTLYMRYRARAQRGAERAADRIDEANPVIVAGFGRFGQVVTRVLRGLGVRATVIDHDPAQIETVRRFGWKAYYGDATRMDLLEQAGAARARLLLVAIDDPDAALRLVKRVRARFPRLELVVRAHGRTDAYEYAALGVSAVRETFASALDAARLVLAAFGMEEARIRSVLERFREHDERQIADNAPHRHDEKKLIALSEQGRRDIAQLLAAEAALAPQVDQRDAGADGERRESETPA